MNYKHHDGWDGVIVTLSANSFNLNRKINEDPWLDDTKQTHLNVYIREA